MVTHLTLDGRQHEYKLNKEMADSDGPRTDVHRSVNKDRLLSSSAAVGSEQHFSGALSHLTDTTFDTCFGDSTSRFEENGDMNANQRNRFTPKESENMAP